MFALFFAMYAFGWMGGGDVKLLSVAFLWIGLDNALPFAFLLVAFTLAYVAAVNFLPIALPVKQAGGRTKIPYGPAISLAWIATLAVAQ